jgi:hypothetical protein
VYAQEIQGRLFAAASPAGPKLPNVRVVLGTAEDPRLPPGGADCFVLLTVYHEVQRPVAFLQTLRRRYAKPGARLAIIDFDDNRHGQPPAPVDHWIPEKDVLDEARAAGWELAERHEFLSSQFFLVFRPARARNDRSHHPAPSAFAAEFAGHQGAAPPYETCHACPDARRPARRPV